jgi:hypothetical protein
MVEPPWKRLSWRLQAFTFLPDAGRLKAKRQTYFHGESN